MKDNVSREQLMEDMIKDMESYIKRGQVNSLTEIATPGVKTPLNVKKEEKPE